MSSILHARNSPLFCKNSWTLQQHIAGIRTIDS